MEAQWPLIVFTLFVCLTCGLLVGMSVLSLRGKGEKILFPGLVTSGISLVVGGIGSFLHLEHWERIFNGFGHITSGITQELIGVVVLAILMVVWFFILRGGKGVPAPLSWITIILTLVMVVATSHSYMMAARPAWGFTLIIFYLANAFLLGALGIWALGVFGKDEETESWAINITFIAALVQVVANVIFVAVCASVSITDFGFYADPTTMTTAPVHIDSLMAVAISGEGALYFWISVVFALVAAICAFLAKKKIGASQAFVIGAAVVAAISSVFFRVLIYVLGFSVFMLY